MSFWGISLANYRKSHVGRTYQFESEVKKKEEDMDDMYVFRSDIDSFAKLHPGGRVGAHSVAR